jgi:hypothetical protein
MMAQSDGDGAFVRKLVANNVRIFVAIQSASTKGTVITMPRKLL